MFAREVYIKRRETLRKMLGSGIVLLPGNNESPINYPNNAYRFRQDSTFLYFFGLDHPCYTAVMDIDSGGELLFGDDYTVDDIIWMGPQPPLAEKAAAVGVETTAPAAEAERLLGRARAQGRTIHYLPPYRADITLSISALLDIAPSEVASKASVELAKAVVALREIKDDGEIAEIERACEIGYEIHTLAMKMCRSGVVEREIAGAIEGIALQYGGGVSFTSIVSQHGETLHNHRYDGILEAGRLLLIDAGAETVAGYASDYTRTFPVSGRFTSVQKAVYEVVLAANGRAFDVAAPDKAYWEVHNEAARVLAEGLVGLGLMRGSVDDIVAEGAQALFMPHGLGHQMGLDVHDMENIGERYVGYDEETLRNSTPGLSALRMGKRLRAGMAITVEPGIYFIPALIAKWKKENLGKGFVNFAEAEKHLGFGGVRIEDDMLVTADGNRMLGRRRPPATVAEIEEFMRR